MRKLAVLAFKEVLLAFRDVGALATMLVTPLALTLVMMAAFGSGSNSSPLSDIPVLLLNKDEGAFGQTLTDLFSSPSVGDLVTATLVVDEAAARARVEADEVAALVVIPADFSQSQTQREDSRTAPVIVEIYASPDWRISALVVKAIVSQGLEMLNIRVAGTTQIVSRLAEGMIQAGWSETDAAAAMRTMPTQFAGREAGSADLPIKLAITSATGRGFSWLGYYASSMAVLFLMFAVTSGGRTLLAERRHGTLPRLLISPTPALTILLGKMGGIVLTGVLQMLILWGATTLIGAYWGYPWGVLLTIVLLVICASSVGALISAWATTPGQAGAIGSAITLIGGALSGSFFVRWNLPLWVQVLSLVTPNAWGIEILSRLQAGRPPSAILPWLGGMLLLTIIYYGAALVGFRRQFK
jgi:ABC-2 type transport system permease protein